MSQTADLPFARTAKDLARLILDAERLTPAGRLNPGTCIAFMVVLGAGLVDVFQAIVRTWRPEYTRGLPSVVALLGVFAGMFCSVLLIVVRLGPHRDGN